MEFKKNFEQFDHAHHKYVEGGCRRVGKMLRLAGNILALPLYLAFLILSLPFVVLGYADSKIGSSDR